MNAECIQLFLKYFIVKYNKYLDNVTKQKCIAQLIIIKLTPVKGMEHMYKARLTITFYPPGNNVHGYDDPSEANQD